MKTKEVLVTCPMCGQAGFTARGLRSHWCKDNFKQPLPKELVQAAIATAEPAAARPALPNAKRELDKRVDARAANGASRRRWFGQQMKGGAK